jgi:hypothetical protein
MNAGRAVRTGVVLAVAVSTVAVARSAQAAPATAAACSSGTHSLSGYRDHVYPETGNGGYRSIHTDVTMLYDAVHNQFLRGNHVQLTERATRCLTDFSLDFERRSPFANGPDMTVNSVAVNGRPAKFTFVQPTYPGDPNGQNDPDPRAHQASQHAVVGGPHDNPLPPACSPELPPNAAPDALDGSPCPANKLVITPALHITSGATFTVTVAYTGRPGLHEDGDGTTEGWFRSNQPVGDGGFVTTEPVGTEDWMPLNDHPSAKPTYDFYDTVTAGRTAVANGILVSEQHNAPNAQFAAGSTSWHWHMAFPVAGYLVENSVGRFDLTERTAPNGIHYYEVQASSLSAAQKRSNQAVMDHQQNITQFQSQFNGTYPFTSAGVLIGRPSASFEEEMEGMITFAGGTIDLDTLNHENMHQWWGDSVSEANYNLTFFKEGLATFGEYLFQARMAADAAGGLSTPAGVAAFNVSLVHQFDGSYLNRADLWPQAPSNPTPNTLFSGSFTYTRPGIAYIALRQILGPTRFAQALQAIQHQYRGATITEPELEAGFHHWMGNQTRACSLRLDQFFRQWFDTGYPTTSGATKPTLTGPGLAGSGFYTNGRSCS